MTRTACFAVLGVLVLATHSRAELPELRPMPRPVVERMEERVRQQLTEARQAVDEELAKPSPEAAALTAALGQLGQFYLSYHLTEAAESVFDNARRLAPGDPRWPYYLGVLHQNERQLEAARQALERVLELRPEDGPATVRLARVYLLDQQPDLAEPLFRSLLDRPGYAAAAHYGLGRIAQLRDDPETAVGHFEKTLELQPEASSAYQSLGMAWRRLGDLDQARGALRQSGQTLVRFADPLVQSLVAEGAAAQMLHGIVAFRQGDYEKALALHEKALELDDDNPTIRRELGLTLQRLGRLDEAITAFSQASKLAPDNARAQYDLGRALAQDETRRDEARQVLRRALKLEPRLRVAHLTLAELAFEDGDFESARAAYEAALQAAPLDPRARRGRALARSHLGEPAAAIQELEAVISEYPEDVEAALDLATILAQQGQRIRAKDILRAATERRSETAFQALAHFNLANLLQEEGDLDGALTHFQRSVDLGPDFRDAHFNLALLWIRAKRFPEAATHFGRTVELDPDDVQARFLHANALLYAGADREARNALEGGLALAPEDARLRHLLARLLATAEAPDLRDGARAEELARALFSAEPSAEHAESVAMAAAANGRSTEAAQWQEQLLTQAERAGAPEGFLARLRANLERYRAGQIARRPWS